MTTFPRTLFEKIWSAHRVAELKDGRALIHFDRHLLHDLTSPQAFSGLEAAGRGVRNPQLCVAIADHLAPTGIEVAEGAGEMLDALKANAQRHGIRHLGMGHGARGIVHVAAVDLGLVLPGMTVACGDSHTPTLGALGCVALGVGTSQVEQLLATQCLALKQPPAMRVELHGESRGPVALDGKTVAMAVVRALGVGGARGMAVEFTGPLVSRLPMEGRFTLCNMAVEAGARAALIAVDDVTRTYLRGRHHAGGQALEAQWSDLRSDDGAEFDAVEVLDLGVLDNLITWGTRPDQSGRADEPIPNPADEPDAAKRAAMERALAYMGLSPGRRLAGTPIDVVFIGSCTNGRLSDLMAAAAIVHGRRVAPNVRALVVPGSGLVKREAEKLGLDRVFTEAGFEWREPGCSLCVGMNGDQVQPGERCVSTSNRNFEGRQGPLARTHVTSPAMAAAAAVCGCIVDVEALSPL